MAQENPSQETAFGYLSTVSTADHGYYGGYLIVSNLGRPLEFHCTSPVRPSRAHEILYGPTLPAFLLGEQIGGALLHAAKLTPHLIVTDQPAMLAVRPQARGPVALVRMQACEERSAELEGRASQTISSSSDGDLGDPTVLKLATPSASACYPCGRYAFDLPPGYEHEHTMVSQLLEQISQQVDLVEPFGRIHEAIREAQRIGAGDFEIHGQAA